MIGGKKSVARKAVYSAIEKLEKESLPSKDLNKIRIRPLNYISAEEAKKLISNLKRKPSTKFSDFPPQNVDVINGRALTQLTRLRNLHYCLAAYTGLTFGIYMTFEGQKFPWNIPWDLFRMRDM